MGPDVGEMDFFSLISISLTHTGAKVQASCKSKTQKMAHKMTSETNQNTKSPRSTPGSTFPKGLVETSQLLQSWRAFLMRKGHRVRLANDMLE